MKTTPISEADLKASVLSVPPLARRPDYAIDHDQNVRLLAHLCAGGVRTFMYGGNANLYNMAVFEFATLLELLQSIAQSDDWMIPSVGSDFGKVHEEERGPGSSLDATVGAGDGRVTLQTFSGDVEVRRQSRACRGESRKVTFPRSGGTPC